MLQSIGFLTEERRSQFKVLQEVLTGQKLLVLSKERNHPNPVFYGHEPFRSFESFSISGQALGNIADQGRCSKSYSGKEEEAIRLDYFKKKLLQLSRSNQTEERQKQVRFLVVREVESRQIVQIQNTEVVAH